MYVEATSLGHATSMFGLNTHTHTIILPPKRGGTLNISVIFAQQHDSSPVHAPKKYHAQWVSVASCMSCLGMHWLKNTFLVRTLPMTCRCFGRGKSFRLMTQEVIPASLFRFGLGSRGLSRFFWLEGALAGTLRVLRAGRNTQGRFRTHWMAFVSWPLFKVGTTSFECRAHTHIVSS